MGEIWQSHPQVVGEEEVEVGQEWSHLQVEEAEEVVQWIQYPLRMQVEEGEVVQRCPGPGEHLSRPEGESLEEGCTPPQRGSPHPPPLLWV